MTDPLHPRATPRDRMLATLELLRVDLRGVHEDLADVLSDPWFGVACKLLDVATAALDRVTEFVRTEGGR